MSQIKQSGQTAVEYILLLSVAVIIAFLIMSLLVSRVEGEEGFIVEKWGEILEVMGDDYADDVPEPPED